MCLLIVAPKCKPDKYFLDQGELENPHGGGIAYRRGHTVHYVKNISANDMYKIIKKEEAPFLCHFRVATAGGVIPELCHPFPVSLTAPTTLSGTAEAVIAHNGSLRGWESLVVRAALSGNQIPGGPWSDTRAMAWFAAISGHAILNFLGEKVAYLSGTSLHIYEKRLFTEVKQKSGVILTSYDVEERQNRRQEELEQQLWIQQHNRQVRNNRIPFAGSEDEPLIVDHTNLADFPTSNEELVQQYLKQQGLEDEE